MKVPFKLTLVLVALIVFFWPGIKEHWQLAHDPYFVPFDAKQFIPAFFKFDSADPIPTTYAKEYILNAICPQLYKASLVFGAHVADVRRFQLAVMYLSYGFFLAVMGRLGWLLGGAVLCFAVLASTMAAWIFIGLGFIGGAPRMYGFPLIALILYALIRDQPKLLGLTAILGALLYPVISFYAGFCFAAWLILPGFANVGAVSNWSLSRRVISIILVGAISLAALAPLFLGGESYGRHVVASDLASYPEAGSEGSYRAFDQLPYRLFGLEWLSYYLGPLFSHGDPLLAALNAHGNFSPTNHFYFLVFAGAIFTLVIFAGIRLMIKSTKAVGMRVIGFFVAAVILHIVAWAGAPHFHIPTRYFMFSLPFLLTFILPWSVYLIVHDSFQRKAADYICDGIFLTLVTLFLVVFAGRGNVEFAAGTVIDPPIRPLLDKIATLPKNVLIAGWPYGILQFVEYTSRRNVFLSADHHQILHLNFTRAMRQRMNVLFDAYFSTEVAPLQRLRQEFGVTHILVESSHFTDPAHVPEYFAPWHKLIKSRLERIKNKAYLMQTSVQADTAIFNQNGLVLLDLRKFPQ